MKYEQYISLIKSLEIKARKNPALYRTKATALAALGYAYILLIMLAPILGILAFVAILWFKPTLLLLLLKVLGKLILILAVFVGGIFTAVFGAIRSFFRDVAKPQGIPVSSEMSPKLFDLIDEICTGVDSPKPDVVLVNKDFNASVMTVPRFGFFGSKTFLNIGLPLVEAVSAKHFRSILAHEMGHISKKHGANSAWIYQLRETWARFLENQEMAESSSFDFLYSGFVNWYFPYFNAYSFVLARAQEREADRMAARLYGPKPLAESLIVTEIKAEYLESDYWEGIFDKAKTDKNPPRDVFSSMQRAFRSESDEGKEIIAFKKALKIRTDYSDTHPSLSDRLELLGYRAKKDRGISRLPENDGVTAAEEYFGERAEKWAVQFDREWAQEILPFWKASNEQWGDARKRIVELDRKNESGEISTDEMYELAELRGVEGGNETAIPLLEAIIQKDPKHAAAQYALGMIFLEANDDRGVEMLKKSMMIDRTITVPVCETLYSYFHSNHKEDEALRYLRKADSFQEVLEKGGSRTADYQ